MWNLHGIKYSLNVKAKCFITLYLLKSSFSSEKSDVYLKCQKGAYKLMFKEQNWKSGHCECHCHQNYSPLNLSLPSPKSFFPSHLSLQLCLQWKKLRVPRSCIHHIDHNTQTRSIAKQRLLNTRSTNKSMDNGSTISSFNNSNDLPNESSFKKLYKQSTST